jgi:hypothetical protein
LRASDPVSSNLLQINGSAAGVVVGGGFSVPEPRRRNAKMKCDIDQLSS